LVADSSLVTGDTASGAAGEGRWDVALSFAGAQRYYVEQVAAALKARGLRVFYDADEQVHLWGRHLAEELEAVYAEQAGAVVLFISAAYAERDWTRWERRAALDRAVAERREYVLPARFDDTRLPGLPAGLAAVDLRGMDPKAFADLVAAKLVILRIIPQNEIDASAQLPDVWDTTASQPGQPVEQLDDPFALEVHPAVSGLTGTQVQVFAELFGDRAAALQLLDEAGYPPALVPISPLTPLLFWAQVSRELWNGAVAGGRDRLLMVARRRFPGRADLAETLPQAETADGRPTAPIAWNVPGRLRRFVGRQDLLFELERALMHPARVALVALEGMGGIGKTALALEYAYLHANAFDVVWWVAAERSELIDQQLRGLARPLGLPPDADPDVVWAGLQSVPSWLVVFDNVEDSAAVARFLPRSTGGGRVLVTSRLRDTRRLGTPISVPVFDRAASVELISGHVQGIDTAIADQIAGLLGYLPLALDQAAGFLDETLIPAERFAQLLTERLDMFLHAERVPNAATSADTTVADLLTLSVDQLRTRQPAAVELLELCALCAPDPIPLDLFTEDASRLGDSELASAAADAWNWEQDAVGSLTKYNLARRDADTVVIHRLIATATRGTLSDQMTAARLTMLASLLRATLSDNIRENPTGWPRWRSLLPHALEVAGRGRTADGETFRAAAWLADHAAGYLLEHGQVALAIDLFERTVTDCRRVLGPDDPDTLAVETSLAEARKTEGRLDEAISRYEQAVAAYERVLGPDDPRTLTCRSNLARAYRTAGRVSEAITLFERVLADRERAFGPEHPDTLASRNNLARAYRTAGRVSESITLLQRAVSDRIRVLGADHPDTFISRDNLARAFESAGRIGEAIVLHHRNLGDRERILGVNHPMTLMSRNNLAYAYRSAGRIPDAIALHERVLADRERVLGSDHPDTLTSRNNLALAYRAAGRLDDALVLHQRVLADRERIIGPDAPDTLISRNDVASDHRAAGRIDVAISLHQRTFSDRERVLGNDHPDTLISRSDLAAAYLAAHRFPEATSLYQQTLTECERALGSDHPLTATVRAALARSQPRPRSFLSRLFAR
jgi:tetratricopeptide (TPR) repeat protein